MWIGVKVGVPGLRVLPNNCSFCLGLETTEIALCSNQKKKKIAGSLIFVSFKSVFPAGVPVYFVCTVPLKAKRGCWILWNCSYR